MKNKSNEQSKDENRDPITGAPGAHPVGTGIGAAGGGGAGAAIGAVGGPIGAGIGLVVGAVAGGYAGKAAAEAVDPTREEAFWRRHYSARPYYRAGRTYSDYQSAYRTGWEAYDRYGRKGKRFDEIEPELRGEYQKLRSRMDWTDARPAVRDAWLRLERNLENLIDFTVVDRAEQKIGTVDAVWQDHTGRPAFLGVRTGWLGLGKIHVLPAQFAEISEDSRKIRLPFGEDVLKQAPSFESQREIDRSAEEEIASYYRPYGFTPAAKTQPAQPKTAQARQSEAAITLSEEQVKIGKREVEYGGIRLRKIIRTEQFEQPVELRREEIVVERVPKTEAQAGPECFQEQEIYIPLVREEAVIAKEAAVKEEVRLRKKSETETQRVSETVRKEDVEIEDTRRGRKT
jgi:uncharacterized protein (TIGR02271 family)